MQYKINMQILVTFLLLAMNNPKKKFFENFIYNSINSRKLKAFPINCNKTRMSAFAILFNIVLKSLPQQLAKKKK